MVVTLNSEDAARLQQTLDTIADKANGARWMALDQLRYFCDGANSALLEAISSKQFNTLHSRGTKKKLLKGKYVEKMGTLATAAKL